MRKNFIEIYILEDGDKANEWNVCSKTDFFERIGSVKRNITNVHDDFSIIMDKSYE